MEIIVKIEKTKTKPMHFSITKLEALVMTTILAKVVFHTDVEAPFCNKNQLKSLNDTSFKRGAESANLPVKEVQEETSDNGLQLSIMGSKNSTSQARPHFIQRELTSKMNFRTKYNQAEIL